MVVEEVVNNTKGRRKVASCSIRFKGCSGV